MLIGIFDPMGAQSDCLQCEVCQNLILSSMNTGFLRYAVATVLTVYGIETDYDRIVHPYCLLSCNSTYRLRYAPKGARQQRSKATMRSAHLKYLNEVKVKQR